MRGLERVIFDGWKKEPFTTWDRNRFSQVGTSGNYDRVERVETRNGLIFSIVTTTTRDVLDDFSYKRTEIERIQFSWDTQVGKFLKGVLGRAVSRTRA